MSLRDITPEWKHVRTYATEKALMKRIDEDRAMHPARRHPHRLIHTPTEKLPMDTMSMPPPVALALLRERVGLLAGKDAEFAQSLLDQHDRRGSLSQKQWPWVQRLAEKATAGPPTAHKVGTMAPVLALFETAAANLTKPAVVLAGPTGGIRLTIAGEGAKVPGSITITSERDEHGEREWLGRIRVDGTFEPARRISGTETERALVPYLVRFATDPAGVAAEHGRLTGKCCFCNIGLKDPRSTAVGYGPKCAERFGLEWGAAKRPAALSCQPAGRPAPAPAA